MYSSGMWPLLTFLAPLIVSNCVTNISEQVLNIGILVSSDPAVGTTVLAAFGLANYIQKVVCFPLAPSKSLGVNIGGKSSVLFVCIVGLVCGLVLVLLGALDFGSMLFGHNGELVRTARMAMIGLAPLPMLWGLTNLLAGVLLRRRKSFLVATSSVVETAVHIIVIGAAMVRARYPGLQTIPPLAVPLVGIYAGAASRLAVVALDIAWSPYDRDSQEDKVSACERERERGERNVQRRHATVRQMAEFCWPLALNELSQRSARPLINWFVSQSAQAPEIAALMVAYPLVNLGYTWLMETKQIPAAFAKDMNVTSRDVFNTNVCCCLCSLAAMSLLALTDLQTWMLITVIGATPEVARQARPALQILSLLPIPVAVRAFYYGWGTFYQRTKPLAPAAVARTAVLLSSLVTLSIIGTQGVILGSVSLLCGFVAEAATIAGVCMWLEMHVEWELK